MNVGVIGTGNVGTSMAELLTNAGHTVFLYDENISQVQGSRDYIQTNVPGASVVICHALLDLAKQSEVLAFSVPDDHISGVAQQVVDAMDVSQKLAVHFSGVLSSTALGEGWCQTFSFHPMKSYPQVDSSIEGVTFTLETGRHIGPAYETLQKLFQSIGIHPMLIETQQKVRYHAAAVVASNLLVGLMACSHQMSGLPDLTALLSLAQGTLNNIARNGVKEALTGPIARGDVQTVKKHLAALTAEERSVYCALSLVINQLSAMPDEVKKEFEHLLKGCQ